MKINLLKIAVRGLELLNVKLKSVLSRRGSYREYYGDLTASVEWKKEGHDASVFTFSPFIWELSFNWKKRSVMVIFEFSIQIFNGFAEMGLHVNVMQDDCRQPINELNYRAD